MSIIRLRMELRALRLAIEDLSEKVQQYSRAMYAAEETKRQKEPPTKKVQAIVTYDDKTVRDTKTDQDRQHRTQNSIRKAAWAAFVAATIYAGIAALTYFPMKKSAEAAKSAADTAAKQLDVVQRPWVRIDTTLAGVPVLDKYGLTVTLKVTMQNSGSSPAIEARMRPKMHVFGGGISDKGVIEERDSLCRELETIQDITSNETIFPGPSTPRNLETVTVPLNDVNAASLPDGFITPVIANCVVYKSGFNNTLHRTAHVFILNILDPAGGPVMGIRLKSGIMGVPVGADGVKPGTFVMLPAAAITAD